MPKATAQIITLADVRAIRNNEPRIQDLRIAEALGMAQPLNIRKVIEKNLAELQRYGEVFTRNVKTTTKGGRPGIVYHLNEAQALLLCMFSRTEKAAEVRKEVIEVFMAYRQGRTPPAPKQQDHSAGFMQPGSNMLLDLLSIIKSARIRVGLGEEPDFMNALENVVAAHAAWIDSPTMYHDKTLTDWDWRRKDWRGRMRGQENRALAQRAPICAMKTPS